MTLTYLQFHAVFLFPVLVVLGVSARRARLSIPTVYGFDARAVGVAILGAAAFIYTTPWDTYLIAQGVWGYGEGAVFATIGYAPVGEYLFFIVQTVLTAFWLYTLGIDVSALHITAPQRALGIGAGGAVSIFGWWFAASDSGFYLGTLLIWAGPVLALQWGFGWTYLLRHGRTVALGVAVPTVYLWVLDTYAIREGIWFISDRYTTGAVLPGLGLPIEEAVFFLLTNVFVVQGLVLWEWVIR